MAMNALGDEQELDEVLLFALETGLFLPEDPKCIYVAPQDLYRIAKQFKAGSELSTGQVGADVSSVEARNTLEELLEGECLVVVDLRCCLTQTRSTHFVVVYDMQKEEDGSFTVGIVDPLFSARTGEDGTLIWDVKAGGYRVPFELFDESWNSNPDGVDRWWLRLQ